MIRPRVIAHRGASHAHADNSWAAFEAALAEGADAIECDVQITLDGVLIVRHDLAIDGALVAEMTLAALHQRAPETVIFSDLIAWRRGRGIGLLVEVKDRAAVQALALALPAEAGPDIVVGGFDAIALGHFKRARPDIATSLMVGSVVAPDDMIALARRHAADGVHPCWEARAPMASALLSNDDVLRLREADLAVTLWHEERPAELAVLIRRGVDAICTDTPGRLKALIDDAFD